MRQKTTEGGREKESKKKPKKDDFILKADTGDKLRRQKKKDYQIQKWGYNMVMAARVTEIESRE